MSDKRSASATLVGDAWGRSAAYDGYADGLHTYCLSLLGDHQVTAEVLREVFVLADRHVGRLRDVDMMQPWLYALTRLECRRHLAGAPDLASRPPDGTPGVPGTTPSATQESSGEASLSALEASLRRAELQLLIWPEAGVLGLDVREALELTVRHGLSARGLAAVLGRSETDVQSLLARAWQELERSQAAVALMKAGPAGCTERALMLVKAKSLTATSRQALLDHSERCVPCRSICMRTAGRPASPGLLPLIPAPRAMREWILGDLESPGPDGREPGAAHDVVFGADGFPVDSSLAHRPCAAPAGRARRTALGFAAVAAVLAFAGTASVLGAGWQTDRTRAADPGAPSSQAAVRQAVPAAPEDAAGSAGAFAVQSGPEIVIVPSVQPARAGKERPAVLPPGTTTGATSGNGDNPGAGSGPRPSGTGGGPPAPSPAPGSLDVQAMSRSGRRGEVEIRLFNSGGMPVTWTAVSSAGHLRLSKSSGTLAPGAHERMTVTVDRDSVPDGPWKATVRFQPAGSVVTVRGDTVAGPRRGPGGMRGPTVDRPGSRAPSAPSSQPSSAPSGSTSGSVSGPTASPAPKPPVS